MTEFTPCASAGTRPAPEHGRGAPDPRALALAGELQGRLPDAQVLLFGSRAVGDWTPVSDIDLAVIGSGKDAAEAALERLRGQAHNPYGDRDDMPYPQIFHYARAEFDELRRSRPHVAGQVQAHGLLPNGARLPPVVQDNPWPGIRNSLLICQRYLGMSITRYSGDEYGRANRYPELYDEIHRTLKTGLTVGLAADGVDYRYDNNLLVLARQLPDRQADWFLELLPANCLRELSAFRNASDYEWDPGRRPWPSTEVGSLLAAVQQACGRFAAEALDAVGKTPCDVGYEPCDKAHPGEWDANGPLGGWESLPLDYFADARMRARARRAEGRITLDACVEVMRVCGRDAMTAAQMDRVEAHWRQHGPPDDAVERALTVRDASATWRDLLVEPQRKHAGPSEMGE